MEGDPRFSREPLSFWAHVRTISQAVGYTQRGTKQVKVPDMEAIQVVMDRLSLSVKHLVNRHGKPTALGIRLLDYFDYRAEVLNRYVEPRLMSRESASGAFKKLKSKLKPSSPIPMNKQKGGKRTPAYFTAIINMLIESQLQGLQCDYDPRQLTTVTRKGKPVRTMARRVDGAFPSPINPVAIWEIKEYYNTKTFGSRVADGVYETLLDGMELEELREHEKIDVRHYLMVDDHYTWWSCGRSYLCRMIDMLNMGYVNEVLFGREVIERLPTIVEQWVGIANNQSTH